jgi:predicted DNA-binding transcriptional regulator AlpA
VTVPNILDQIAADLARIEAKLGEALAAPAAESGDESIWADGAMDLADAEKFSGISRTEMYALMRSGDLPFTTPTRERLVPRRWLVQYLESKQHAAPAIA